MRAFTYARVSTDLQADRGTSLDEQHDVTKLYCERRGWTVVGEESDVVSGARASRPGFDLLMEAVRRGGVDVVVVSKLDRLGRSVRNIENVLHELEEHNVAFVSVREQFDTSTLMGKAMRQVAEVFAELERGTIRERTMAGRLHRVVNDKLWVGGRPPFGFQVVDQHLVVNEDEAAVIRRAAALVLDGLNSVEAAQQLNVEGLRPRFNPDHQVRQRPDWTANSFRHVLRDSAIAGRFIWKRKDGTQHELPCPAILDAETFSDVQDALRWKKAKPKRWRSYPASGHIVMPCGNRATGRTSAVKGRKYSHYRCRGKDQGVACDCRMLRAEEVENLVWGALAQHLDSEAFFVTERRTEKQQRPSKALKKQLVDLDQQIDAALEQRILRPAFADRVDALLDRLQEDRKRLEERMTAEQALEADEATREAARQAIRTITVKTALTAEDYEALGLEVRVLDFKPLKVDIKGAVDAVVTERTLRQKEQKAVDAFVTNEMSG